MGLSSTNKQGKAHPKEFEMLQTATRPTPTPHPQLDADPTGWVDAAPFRAWLRQLLSDTGLPWRVLARAAQVQPGVVQRLLQAPPRQIRRRDAQQLLRLDTATFGWLSREPAPCETVRLLAWTLGLRGAAPVEIAHFIGSDIASVRHLMAGAPIWCSRLMQLRAEAACQAWGADPDELLRR